MGEHSHPKHQGSIEQDIKSIIGTPEYGQLLNRLHEDLHVIGETLLQYSFSGKEGTYEETKREHRPLITYHGGSGLLTFDQAAELGFGRITADD